MAVERSGRGVMPLRGLSARFEANCAALERSGNGLAGDLRGLKPAGEYWIGVEGDRIVLSRGRGGEGEVLGNPVTAAVAARTVGAAYPKGVCDEPMLVAGLDQGWLWSAVYGLPTGVATWPGYRPPLYFLARDLERLWVVLHIHDWGKLLSDGRVRLFVGSDAVERCRRELIEKPELKWPKLSVTVDEGIWPRGMDHQGLINEVGGILTAEAEGNMKRYGEIYRWATPGALAAKLRGGGRLRVMGITSRYTTFLQYSMRDWLSAFEEMGHEVRLLIEGADHELVTRLMYSRACVEYEPDVILMLDHYRGESPTLPKEPLCVMWVQDGLPGILNKDAGEQQGERDFALGYGRSECVGEYGYPARRFMPSRIGVNERRFSPGGVSGGELERHRCDVSYVSHASVPAELLVKAWLSELSQAEARRGLERAFERVRGIYEAGGSITEQDLLSRVIEEAFIECGVGLEEAEVADITGRFFLTVNNALFRHQSLLWLADAGLDLRLYGRGWEKHPRLGRYARGVADNELELRAIYQASGINLQVTPHGAVHQRLCDGLAAGGFFLLRRCGADMLGAYWRELWGWCEREGIEDGRQFLERATAEVEERFDRQQWLLRRPWARDGRWFVDCLAEHARGGFGRMRRGIWPEGSDYVSLIYKPVWEWCERWGVERDGELLAKAPPEILAKLGRMRAMLEEDVSATGARVLEWVRQKRLEGEEAFAGSIWGEYGEVAFGSAGELREKAAYFLAHGEERRRIAESMRGVVLERFSYRSINGRLLELMASELESLERRQAAA